MTSKEVSTLIDLGASQTKTRFLVNMRTGGEFGNPTKLFTDFHQLAKDIRESYGRANDITAMELLTEPISTRLESAIHDYSPTADDTLSDTRVFSEIQRQFAFISREEHARTGVPSRDLTHLIDLMKDKHLDEQAHILKAFIEDQPGGSGFAAIHQLLGAHPDDLHIRSEAGYNTTISNAKKFIATFAEDSSDLKDPRVNLHAYDTRKDRKKIKKCRCISSC